MLWKPKTGTFKKQNLSVIASAYYYFEHLKTKPDIVTASYRRRLIYDVLKTSDLRCLEDVRFTTSWRRLICVVLKTSDLRRLKDVWFTPSWRRSIYDVLKTSVKRRLCSNEVGTPIQRRKKWFFLPYSENFKRLCLG